jgi:RNA polymerase sigma factor (sigma-70 family)
MIARSEEKTKKEYEGDFNLTHLANYLTKDFSNGKKFYSLCSKVSNILDINSMDFEEIYQDLFIESLDLKQYDSTRSAEQTYLFTRFKWKCMDFLRKRKKDFLYNKINLEELENSMEMSYWDVVSYFNQNLAHLEEDPSKQLIKEEEEENLRNVVINNAPLFNTLQRGLLMNHYWGQTPYKQLVEDFEIPIGTVKSSLSSARKRLKKSLVQTANESFYK